MTNAPIAAHTPAFIGCDIDVTSGDMVLANGDLQLVAGWRAAQQELLLDALTDVGTLLFHPTQGLGLSAIVEQPLTVARQSGIADRIKTRVAQYAWCKSVVSVTLENRQNVDGSGGTALVIVVTFIPTGGLEALTLQVPLTGVR